MRWRQIRKLTFGHCLEATPFRSAFGQVTEPLTFTMKIMTCSCAKSPGGVTVGSETPPATQDSIWRTEFALIALIAPENNQSVCNTTQETWNCECICANGCVCVFGYATEAQMVLKGYRCQTEGAEGSNLKLSGFRFMTFRLIFFFQSTRVRNT